MDFNNHSRVAAAGGHAFLSPSTYHWINYDEDKLHRVFETHMAARRGTEFHALAAELIRMGVKLPDNTQTFNAYVNDAIGFRMTPEQILFYSENCFGTADAICYRNNKLRIHDLKMGVTPASIHQLEIYFAIFCLEYRMKPTEVDCELRIYQNDTIQEFIPNPVDIILIIDKIQTFDRYLKQLRSEA